eukprot:scaffold5466_cov108-Isochrysis_galbana.AAC.10
MSRARVPTSDRTVPMHTQASAPAGRTTRACISCSGETDSPSRRNSYAGGKCSASCSCIRRRRTARLASPASSSPSRTQPMEPTPRCSRRRCAAAFRSHGCVDPWLRGSPAFWPLPAGPRTPQRGRGRPPARLQRRHVRSPRHSARDKVTNIFRCFGTGGCWGCSQSCRLCNLVARREGATQLSTYPCEVPAGCSHPGARVQQLGVLRTKHPCRRLALFTLHFPFAVSPRSKYDVPSAAPGLSPHARSVMGRNDMYLRPKDADSASQRSAGSCSQHSSQDGAVLGRFPKPAAMFRTPATTPSLEPGLVNSLLRQQAERNKTIRGLTDRVLGMEGVIATLKDTNMELMRSQTRREAVAHPA